MLFSMDKCSSKICDMIFLQRKIKYRFKPGRRFPDTECCGNLDGAEKTFRRHSGASGALTVIHIELKERSNDEETTINDKNHQPGLGHI